MFESRHSLAAEESIKIAPRSGYLSFKSGFVKTSKAIKKPGHSLGN